ncbi:PAS domain-containing sensor histidine kinase [Ectothiorhodospiraceae bacterium BW-2]|nr:PAS domain-containing sensor histidine kinase [Ectothiorhodospiraceae bacterium BW-2]
MTEKEVKNSCRQVLDILQSAVLLFDNRLMLRYLNTTGEMVLGVSMRRVSAMSALELLQDSDLVALMEQALQEGNPIARRGITLRRLHGGDITVDLMAIPTYEVSDAQELIVEITQIDRRLRITREEGLMAMNQATRVLVRGLAHEIKNPLGGVRGAAQLLERELHDEELKEYTQVIIREADRLQELIDQMLGPKSPPVRRMISIHEALERVRQIVKADFPTTLEIIRDYDPSIPELMADLDQLIQALMNLARNAAQAVNGNGRVTLRTRAVHQFTIGNQIHKLVAKIDIIDNGPGIDKDISESIFLPMISSKREGTGLGLPIAQSLINLHNGLIEWQSRAGHTQFTVLLPIITTPISSKTGERDGCTTVDCR